MKYLIVNQFSLPPRQSGGTRHFDIGVELVRNGHEVHIVASNTHYSTRKLYDIPGEKEVVGGVAFYWIKTIVYHGALTRLINHLQFSIKSFFFLVKTNRVIDADIVVGSSPQPFGVFSAWLFSKLYKKKFYYEVRDLWPQTLLDMEVAGPTNIVVRIFSWIEKVCARDAVKVLCLMPGGVQYFLDRGIPKDKIAWVPNGVQMDDIPVESDKVKNSEILSIGYFGSHGPSDGLDFVVGMAERLSCAPVRFILVGDGPSKKELLDEVEKKEIKNIIFQESMPKALAIKKMGECDVLLALAKSSPLYKWGISYNKIYDYFKVRKPIFFVGDVYKNPIEESGGGLILKKFDLEKAKTVVEQLLGMTQEERAIMGEKGRIYCAKNHDIKIIAKTFE